MTQILDGQKLAGRMLTAIRETNAAVEAELGSRPLLAMVRVADGNLMSETAALLHANAADRCGCGLREITLPETVTEDELCATVMELNDDDAVTAILVLQPLPAGFDVRRVINTIDPGKDAEGLHPVNLAGLFKSSRERRGFEVCVPQALKLLLEEYGLFAPDKRWAVLAQDRLLEEDVIAAANIQAASISELPKNTVLTVVTPNHPEAKAISRSADFVLATSRDIHWLDRSWIKEGATVIDFLANMVGRKPHPVDPDRALPVLKGSVDPVSIKGHASFFSPVVGGVGPMLLASLFFNCAAMHREARQI